jgi:hypothetical protein
MATTTNYSWATPDDTALVKDGAAAIRSLGTSIDTTTKNLNPSTTLGDIEYRSSTANTNTRLGVGTTGQVLTVAGGVPSWATPTTGDIEGVTAGTGISGGGTSGTVTITNSMATEIAAAGDIIIGTGSGTFDNLPIGTTGQLLTADTTVSPYKVKWATPSGSSPASASATVSTTETTTSNTFTDLTTAGPAVTLTTGTKALVLINSTLYKQASGSNAYVGFAVSGATTLAASNTTALNYVAAAYYDSRLSVSHRITGLTAGSNTFTLKYRQNGGGTAEFANREIIVIDLGS